MDTEQLVAHSRARFDHEVSRRTLREKYQAKMIFAHAGGMWQAGPELLMVLNCVAQNADVVLLDLYQTPVKVAVSELQKLAAQRWQEQMNAWLVEHEELNQRR